MRARGRGVWRTGSQSYLPVAFGVVQAHHAPCRVSDVPGRLVDTDSIVVARGYSKHPLQLHLSMQGGGKLANIAGNLQSPQQHQPGCVAVPQPWH